MEQKSSGVLLQKPEGSEVCSIMSQSHDRHNRIKVLFVMLIAVIVGAIGDVTLSKGMKMVGAAHHESVWAAFIFAVTNLYVVIGAAMLIVFLLLYLASLSWEDLSYVLPLTAADYVLVTLLAHFFIGEGVSDLRWAGSCCVAVGIALVART